MEKFTKTKYDNIEVTNYGRVYNSKTERFIGSIGTNGYMKIRIRVAKNEYRTTEVHRLVAETIISGYQPGYVVDHIDDNKLNNRADNLRWVTPSVNTLKAKKAKKFTKLSQAQKDEAKALYVGGMSLIKITIFMNDKYGINVSRHTYTKYARA